METKSLVFQIELVKTGYGSIINNSVWSALIQGGWDLWPKLFIKTIIVKKRPWLKKHSILKQVLKAGWLQPIFTLGLLWYLNMWKDFTNHWTNIESLVIWTPMMFSVSWPYPHSPSVADYKICKTPVYLKTFHIHSSFWKDQGTAFWMDI